MAIFPVHQVAGFPLWPGHDWGSHPALLVKNRDKGGKTITKGDAVCVWKTASSTYLEVTMATYGSTYMGYTTGTHVIGRYAKWKCLGIAIQSIDYSATGYCALGGLVLANYDVTPTDYDPVYLSKTGMGKLHGSSNVGDWAVGGAIGFVVSGYTMVGGLPVDGCFVFPWRH